MAEWWDRPAGDLRFAHSDSGKPYVLTADGAAGPAFSLSHSADWVAVAVAGSRAIGVDVQRIAPHKAPVAERVFGTADAGELAALPPDQAAAEFTRRWTVAEACAKADGRGIELLLGGVGPIGSATSGAWGDYRWWSGQIGDVHWSLAMTADAATAEPVVREIAL